MIIVTLLPSAGYSAETTWLIKHKNGDQKLGSVDQAIGEWRDINYDLGVIVRCNRDGTIIDTIKLQRKVAGSKNDHKTFLAHSMNTPACNADVNKYGFNFVLLEFNWEELIDGLKGYSSGNSVSIKVKHKSTGAGSGNTDGWKHLEVRLNSNGLVEWSKNGEWSGGDYHVSDNSAILTVGSDTYTLLSTAVFQSNGTANDIRMEYQKLDSRLILH